MPNSQMLIANNYRYLVCYEMFSIDEYIQERAFSKILFCLLRIISIIRKVLNLKYFTAKILCRNVAK